MNTGVVESVQVDSTEAVMAHLARVKAAGKAGKAWVFFERIEEKD